jgi:hypothetical protein
MRVRLDGLFDVLDLAILANVKGPTARILLFSIRDAKGVRYFSIRIAKNRIIQVEALSESSIRIHVVAARCEICHLVFANLIAARTERLAFFRSPAGKCLREPGDDDRRFAFHIRKFIGLPVTPLEFKVWSGIAWL